MEEVGEVCGETLLGEGPVGHPEGEVEAFPELEGVGGEEGAAGGEEGLEGVEGGGAKNTVWKWESARGCERAVGLDKGRTA